MKRLEIRKAMDSHLKAAGFSPGTWIWNGSELVLSINNRFHRIKFKAGMPKWQLIMQMGRVTGWSEMLGINTANAATA